MELIDLTVGKDGSESGFGLHPYLDRIRSVLRSPIQDPDLIQTQPDPQNWAKLL